MSERSRRSNPMRPYDLILMLDVLEHVEHPAVVLRQAIEWLKPDGAMLITVPAFDWLWTAHDDLNHHVKRYSAAELRELVRSARTPGRRRRGTCSSPSSVPKTVRPGEGSADDRARLLCRGCRIEFSTRHSGTWFQLESAVAGWLPFGSSILLIADARAMTRRHHCGTGHRPHRAAGAAAHLPAEAGRQRRDDGRRCVVHHAREGARPRRRIPADQFAAAGYPADVPPGFPASSHSRFR